MSIYSQGCITYGEHRNASYAFGGMVSDDVLDDLQATYDKHLSSVGFLDATLDRVEQINEHTFTLWFDYDCEPFTAYSQYGDVIRDDADDRQR